MKLQTRNLSTKLWGTTLKTTEIAGFRWSELPRNSQRHGKTEKKNAH